MQRPIFDVDPSLRSLCLTFQLTKRSVKKHVSQCALLYHLNDFKSNPSILDNVYFQKANRGNSFFAPLHQQSRVQGKLLARFAVYDLMNV